MRLWRIDTPAQTMVLGSDDGMACCHYWGAPLPGDTDLDALVAAAAGGITGGMLDALPPLSLVPEARRSFPGQPGWSRSRTACRWSRMAPQQRGSGRTA